jgi:hypothetical protein
VAIRDSAVGEFITHEESGVLAEDDEGFAMAVAHLVNNDGARSKIAAFNRSAPVSLDWDHALAIHEHVYDRAKARLGSHHGPQLPAS